MSEEQQEGVVKWFNADKGYGFIGTENTNKDIFVHCTALEGSGVRSLYEGQRVQYSIGKGAKGECANNVVVID